jgi:hypothetical protein
VVERVSPVQLELASLVADRSAHSLVDSQLFPAHFLLRHDRGLGPCPCTGLEQRGHNGLGGRVVHDEVRANGAEARAQVRDSLDHEPGAVHARLLVAVRGLGRLEVPRVKTVNRDELQVPVRGETLGGLGDGGVVGETEVIPEPDDEALGGHCERGRGRGGYPARRCGNSKRLRSRLAKDA